MKSTYPASTLTFKNCADSLTPCAIDIEWNIRFLFELLVNEYKTVNAGWMRENESEKYSGTKVCGIVSGK